MAETTPLPKLLLGRFKSDMTCAMFAQFFLAIGWLRAAVDHLVTASWWSGDQLSHFLVDRTALANPLYDNLFLDPIVARVPVLVSVIVVLAEVVIGAMLLLGLRTRAAALAGIFLNLHFILAGVVNPSVFYIMLAGVVVLAPLSSSVSSTGARFLARRVTIVCAVATVVLVPFITTFDPALVIADPSLVLISIMASLMVAVWHLVYNVDLDQGVVATVTVSDEVVEVANAELLVKVAESKVAESKVAESKVAEFKVDEAEAESQVEQINLGSRVRRRVAVGAGRGLPRRPLSSNGSVALSDGASLNGSGFTIVATEDDDDAVDHETADADTGDADEVVVGGTDAGDGGGSDGDVRSNRHRRGRITSDGDGDDDAYWYSVRCHFALGDDQYEERITAWAATDFDDAMTKAEYEARVYARTVGGSYLGSCDCYALGPSGPGLTDGQELYSLVRTSELEADDYLRTHFFTGAERSMAV